MQILKSFYINTEAELPCSFQVEEQKSDNYRLERYDFYKWHLDFKETAEDNLRGWFTRRNPTRLAAPRTRGVRDG